MKTCRGPKRNLITRGWLVAGLLLLQGCATYSQSFYPVESKLVNQDPAGALQQLEKQGYDDKDQLLFLLNKAMLQRMQNDFQGSNQTLEQAKGVIEAYSALSVTEQAGSFIINDSTRTYTGTPLDQVMLHTYAALNYLQLKNLDAARVEILQINLLLRKQMADAPNSALSVDPFSRYLAGMVYEDLGEYSDAMIAYRNALQAYQTHRKELYPLTIPETLKTDLLRSAKRIGLDNEYQKLSQEFNIKESAPGATNAQLGEVVLLFQNGLAPVMREKSAGLVDPGSGQLIRISLPYYQDRPKPVLHVRVSAGDTSQDSEVVEQIDAIDHATLKAYLPAISARALARGVMKYKAAKEAGKNNGWAGLLVNIAGFVTEQADTRSWLTLPAEIQMARLPLAAGEHEISISLLGHHDQVIRTVKLGQVNVIAGKRQYMSYHYIPSYTIARH